MASISPSWYYQDGGLRRTVSVGVITKKFFTRNLKLSFAGPFPPSSLKFQVGISTPAKKNPLVPRINCEKPDKEINPVEHVTVERYPYHSYMDSTSGQMEPASGARASIPGEDLWPEGTASRVRAARAPEPTAVSTGKPSFGKSPGSRRKKYKPTASASASTSSSELSETDVVVESQEENASDEPNKDNLSEFVVYETEPEAELTGYDLDKKVGNPHPFIDPRVKQPVGEPLSSDELWWNWRRSSKDRWSKWQRRRPDVETVFLKAMAETGQIKLYGDNPTLTECALYRARRHVYKEERLQKEQENLERIGPMAYYSEWVSAWKKDTSREAVQKHFEETGEDETAQLIEMFTCQTDREYRIMMGTDNRIRRDPLAMRLREDQIKQIWGGDPIYPTVNYIQDPDEVIDFRGPDFHEPTPPMLAYLKEHGKVITREELEKILAKERSAEVNRASNSNVDDAMAEAVDIGENDDEEEENEAEGDDKTTRPGEGVSEAEGDDKTTRPGEGVSEAEGDDKTTLPGEGVSEAEGDEKITASKSNPPEMRETKEKQKTSTMEEAIDDSENLADFIVDFEEDQ